MSEINGKTSDGYHTFDELYEHRVTLFLNLVSVSGWESYFKRDHYEGWHAVYLIIPDGGQISYHVPDKWTKFLEKNSKDITNEPDIYDGHNSEIVLERLGKTLEVKENE